MRIHNGGVPADLREIVLFPFDDCSIPLQQGVKLALAGHHKGFSGATRIVLPCGPEGACDHQHIAYYGTVIRVGDEYRMWYLGQGDPHPFQQRVCLAVSKDGRRWEKPDLGLVEYKGSRRNNLVRFDGGDPHVMACVVFYEPDEKDPAKRFKMAFEYEHKLNVAFSADGLSWTVPQYNPVVAGGFEHTGGVKIGDCYYIAGHGGAVRQFSRSRSLVVYVSHDFERWAQAACMGFRRDPVPPKTCEYVGPYLEPLAQVHLGAGLWNRGNVIIGFYGKWNHHPSGDRRLVTMDLGLVVSNDGLHYKEPIPDYPIISAVEDGPPWGAGLEGTAFPRSLCQGQGFENIGEETLVWYGLWPDFLSDGVRLAAWPRDRLGYFSSFVSSDRNPHFVSAPIELEGRPAKVYLNADGIGMHNRVEVEVLNDRFEPIPGYSGAECLAPRESGLRQQVLWTGTEILRCSERRIRLKVGIAGLRAEDVRLYAVYLQDAGA